MLKRIDVRQLKPGMYIHDLNCEWMAHPFIRKRFRVTSEDEIAQVGAAGIREVYIDTERGEDAPDAPTESDVRLETEQAMLRVAAAPQRPIVSMREELGRARRIVGEASKIVHDIMRDARLGKQVRLEKIEPMVERITDSILRNSGALLSLSRVKNKDDYTFVHSVSVCALLVSFGRALGMGREEIQLLGIGGMLHDIGKTAIPDTILNKPGRLTQL